MTLVVKLSSCAMHILYNGHTLTEIPLNLPQVQKDGAMVHIEFPSGTWPEKTTTTFGPKKKGG